MAIKPPRPQDGGDLSADNMHNKRLGAKGEAQARRYLRLHGWKILKKNFKSPFGEIDIIARKGEVTAFIEVKTRLTDNFGAPRRPSQNSGKGGILWGQGIILQTEKSTARCVST